MPVEGRINCKTRGGYLYLLWSRNVPQQQYLGSSSREPRKRLGEHRRDISDGKVEKAVACHFADTHSHSYEETLCLFLSSGFGAATLGSCVIWRGNLSMTITWWMQE